MSLVLAAFLESVASPPNILLIVSEDNGPELGCYSEHAKRFINASESPFFLNVNYPDAHDPWLKQVDRLPEDPQLANEIEIKEYTGIQSPELRGRVADYCSSDRQFSR